MYKQKKVMAIHDISCFGKCSLTVALPILSAAGIETSVIPTAVLSTHTGGFKDYTYRDLTEDIPKIANHWKSLGLTFDGIYTGFLGSFEQLKIVAKVFDDFKGKDTLICVDPAMADNGSLYQSFPPDFPNGMAKLCKKADIIVPNMTEAALLLGEEYKAPPYNKDYIREILKKLAEIGPREVVLTSVRFDYNKVGSASYNRDTGETNYALTDCVDGYYHGTGDVFASVLFGALINGFSIDAASNIAAKFTSSSIARTHAAGTDTRFGVNFEAGLIDYAQIMKKQEF